jgi:hypothetical protein
MPFIHGLVTAFSPEDDTVVRQGVIGPSTPFLQKPFSALELDRKVRAALES